jgi:hypothetical protein
MVCVLPLMQNRGSMYICDAKKLSNYKKSTLNTLYKDFKRKPRLKTYGIVKIYIKCTGGKNI